MPRCLRCGNRKSFVSSKVLPASPYSNGPLSGLIGDFKETGLEQLTSMGAVKAVVNAASSHPKEYFDTCFYCGSQEVAWEEDLAAAEANNIDQSTYIEPTNHV